MGAEADAGQTASSDKGLPAIYRLRLFVAGDEPNSARAKAVLARICDKYLSGRCEVVVEDVLQDFQAAIEHRITVVPTLIVEFPPPPKTIIGSLSDESKLLAALGIFPQRGIL